MKREFWLEAKKSEGGREDVRMDAVVTGGTDVETTL